MSDAPEVLVPYVGASCDSDTQDIFLFMRPSTNGVLGEHAVLNTISKCGQYKKGISLIYLANIPSSALISKHIYQKYYALKIHFANRGGDLFTPYMRRAFSSYFHIPYHDAHIIGSFQALREFSMSARELFDVWVKEEDICVINGQSIKRYRGAFIVNYDIPHLLHIHSLHYDIAAMCFRMKLPYHYFSTLIGKIKEVLVHDKVIRERDDIGRAFHYSYGPFDQLRDGMAFVFTPDGNSVPLEELSFGHYIHEQRGDLSAVKHLLINPIVTIPDADDADDDNQRDLKEVSLFDYTRGNSYEMAFRALDRVIANSVITPPSY